MQDELASLWRKFSTNLAQSGEEVAGWGLTVQPVERCEEDLPERIQEDLTLQIGIISRETRRSLATSVQWSITGRAGQRILRPRRVFQLETGCPELRSIMTRRHGAFAVTQDTSMA